MFNVLINDKVQRFDALNDATKEAERAAGLENIEVKVTHAETDVVVFVTSPRAIRKQQHGEAFVPWTRVETPKHQAPEFADFVPAYTRKRIQATVYRGQTKGSWRVFDGRTGRYRDVANTTESRHLLTDMRHGLML